MGVLAAQQDEVVVILHPARVLHVEHQDLALSARLPSQRIAPEVYNLSDLDWADIKVLSEIVMAIKLAQETMDVELYITGSRVVAILEKIRADLIFSSGRIWRRELAC